VTQPYRQPGPSSASTEIVFQSRQEERVWREFLTAIIRSGRDSLVTEIRCADKCLLAWRERGGNDP
jgi:hypothetical protein